MRGKPSVRPGLFTCIFIGAASLGAAGFCGGFFGPIIFTPEANQGPLLGIFITGPLGLLLGAVLGGITWSVRSRKHRQTPQPGTPPPLKQPGRAT